MTIANLEDMFNHMSEIGVRFRESFPKADSINHFDRYENGKVMAEHVDTWLYWNGDSADAYIEIGADYEGFDIETNPDLWFSEHFSFPFESDTFDAYLFDIETYQL